MHARQVELERDYLTRINGNPAVVRILSICPYGGWYAANLRTGRPIRIRSPKRIERPIEAGDRRLFGRFIPYPFPQRSR